MDAESSGPAPSPPCGLGPFRRDRVHPKPQLLLGLGPDVLEIPRAGLLGPIKREWGCSDPSAPSPAPEGSVSTDSLSSKAFVSKRASTEMRRHKRNYAYDSSAYGAVRDPLEAKREVCEFNPACDELADLIGFQEAYRRYYGLA
ncbi:osteocalcin [Pezoporus wallicus]|uniref:osteocalcin n=1 Tax=Pezoporus wallicus TaxID=35540 RepID=UPI00254FC00A|nr:osteocalcin [Pezoporus wallicus]